jgi:large subunit ribosomal protein L18
VNTFRTAQKQIGLRRRRRRDRVRSRVLGTAERPRLAVFRSHKHFYCQMIDDRRGVTLAAASTRDAEACAGLKHGGSIEAARRVGERIAAAAKERGLTRAVLDRRHYAYHGRVRAFADAARKGGLQF